MSLKVVFLCFWSKNVLEIKHRHVALETVGCVFKMLPGFKALGHVPK